MNTTTHALVAGNEFNTQLASTGTETAASAAAAHAKALVEARYIMALRRPRDMDVVREKILKECRRPGFAAVARYQKPIGKDRSKWPTGPSIRFAETAVRCMTNVTVETSTSYDDRERRIVHVEVTDLESNVPYGQDIVVHKTVERRNRKEGDVVLRTRSNSSGEVIFILEATDDEIINKQAALVSKAMRTQALRLIPGDIVEEAMDAVLETQRREDAKDPDEARRRLFDAYGQVGVRAEQLKEYLGHDGKTLSPAEMSDLRALYAAIRDGEASWRDIMDARAAESAPAAGAGKAKAAAKSGMTLEQIRQRAAARRDAKKPGPAGQAGDAAGAGAAPSSEAGAPSDAAAHPSYAQLAEAMLKAPDRESADQVLDRGRDLPDEQREDLARLYEERFPD